ncbi:unnamed protein product [Nezara viridula]|uniref:Uncharacterized protein n=1 Tax=Nezara viridula TaxID=85310 RepID=A0A9P0MIW4_NEZVI|nr:unnamed protein product [Nezara viridula]
MEHQSVEGRTKFLGHQDIFLAIVGFFLNLLVETEGPFESSRHRSRREPYILYPAIK